MGSRTIHFCDECQREPIPQTTLNFVKIALSDQTFDVCSVECAIAFAAREYRRIIADRTAYARPE